MLERYERLVDEHRDRVYTYACHLLRDREEAADVTQEVLIRLWRNLGTLEGNLSAWLAKVTRNRCYDVLRRRKSQRAALGAALDDESLAELVETGPGPERRATDADLDRQLRQAVEELAEPYRSVVLLREVHEMKYHEISDALEMPLNTVKVNLHRARRLLRERCQEVIGHAAAG